MLKGRHVIEPGNLSIQELEDLFDLAEDIIEEPEKYAEVCRGKILATLFFEPSTRTRFSFEAAMLRLGGSTLGFADPGASSASKGESLADTIRTVSSYADIIAMRNPKEGAALLASQFSSVPVINAGDGGHHHPTQTLTDILTIRSLKGKTEGLTIGLCGDLKFGRTVHSLAKAMARYPKNRFVLISPPELEIPDYIVNRVFKPAGIPFTQVRRLEDSIGDLDILYMTRVQKERFFNEQDYIRLKDSYILDAEKMKLARKDLSVLHPLPRVNEIATEVDSDPRAAYFTQVKYGMYVRMALISRLLGARLPAVISGASAEPVVREGRKK
jgi:aspartate carbamoyltransferase catalytic subunit